MAGDVVRLVVASRGRYVFRSCVERRRLGTEEVEHKVEIFAGGKVGYIISVVGFRQGLQRK